MLVKRANSNKFTVILNNYDLKEDCLKNQLKEVFIKLKKDQLESGIYNVNALIDNNYGMILEIEKIMWIDIYLDLNVKIDEGSIFLYRIDDYFHLNKDYVIKYYFDKKIYYELKKNLDKYEQARLMENSELIYGNEAKLIRIYGKVV